jgi:large subunit ribosomal protein L10
MRREEKDIIINDLLQKLSASKHFYLADISALNAEETAALRRTCFERDIELLVVKNTLLKKALEKMDNNFDALYDVLHYATSVMFCESASVPAKLIKEFRKNHDKPILKAAFVEESVYIGDNQLDALTSLKTKDELVADVLMLLQSPMKSVLSALSSSGSNIAGVLKTLSEKKES